MLLGNFLVGCVVLAAVFIPYFRGAFQSQRSTAPSPPSVSSIKALLTSMGFLWAIALPVCWLLQFYTFVVVVRISVGDWPQFNQRLAGWWSTPGDVAIRYLLWALVSSLYVSPILLFTCVCLRRWRHISVYVLAYDAAIGIACAAMFLAPRRFLNWFFD